MADSSFISRKKPVVDELDFDTLRSAGIALVQSLSGDRWSDFNTHDPGVTILESLCYALSDMAYRSEFETSDYLVGSDGKINFEGLALFRPDEVLPCDPVTIEDLRKVLLSEIPEIRNVWLERSTGGPLASALYAAFVQLHAEDIDVGDGARRHAVEKRLREVIQRFRPLGEDIDSVEFIEIERFGLSAEIEVADGSDALPLVAEVFWRAQEYLNPRPAWRSYQDELAQGTDLEAMLCGPLTEMGVLASHELEPWRDRFSVSELIGIVAGLPGVERINRLAFVDSSGEETESIDLRNPAGRLGAMIDIQASDGDAGVTLLRSGRHERFAAAEIEREIARLTIQRSEFRSRPIQFDWVRALMPRGTLRPFAAYHSIQHHFPDIYGLNAFGVPSSAGAERHAQALQLKGYLMLHEQFLANYLAQIEYIPELFSLFPGNDRTNSTKLLGNDDVPRAEELYPKGMDGQRRMLGEMLDEFDDWVERRHRLLNRLLAMHGHDETRQLVDAIALARRLDDRQSLAAKQWLLSNIREFGKSRASGGCVADTDRTGRVRSGVERNLAILLGVQEDRYGEDDSEMGGAHPVSFRVVDHVLLRAALGNPAVNSPGPEFFLSRISIVISETFLQCLSGEAHTLIGRAIAICCPAHIAARTVVLDERRFDSFLEREGRWRGAVQHNDEAALASESLALVSYLNS